MSLFYTAPWSSGQVIQLGPFAFDAQTRLEAIYTTNVEQERKSEATADRQDYYLVWGLDLKSTTDFLPRTKLSIDTGIAIEKHFNRPDLDNQDNPFARFGVESTTDRDPLKITANATWETSSESTEDVYVPPNIGVSRKKRQTGTSFDYGIGADWQGERLTLGASYEMSKERYDDDELEPTESDDETISYTAGIKLGMIRGINVGVTYEKEYSQNVLVNVPGDPPPRDVTETITLDFDTTQNLLERPQITYSIGIQREYDESEGAQNSPEGWEIIHTIGLTDDFDISPALNLKVNATYDIEETPEEDDVAFQYGLTITHEISARSSQSFNATREPVNTLGSTTDTDEQDYVYALKIDDFIMQNVAFSWSAGYTISRPVDGDEERTWDYALGLKHSIPITARITRSIAYDYTREDSNLEDELLEEHRITLSFIYQL